MLPVLLFLTAFPAALPGADSRRVEVSVKAGVPLTDAFQTSSYGSIGLGFHEGHSATRRYTAGIGGVIRLPRSLGIEAHVLYKRLGYDITDVINVRITDQHTWTTANSWEFPLLGMYRFPRLGPADSPVESRILAGLSFRTTTGARTVRQCIPTSPQNAGFCPSTAPTATPADGRLALRSRVGATVGAGIGLRFGKVRLTPELRYTRWRNHADTSTLLYDLWSNPNQVDILLGIGF